MTTEERFAKIENAIRDLIVVSRTLLESQKETTTQIGSVTAQIGGVTTQIGSVTTQFGKLTKDQQELRDRVDRKFAELAELHEDTQQKLNALIEVVDQIIRRKNGQ